MYYDKKLVLNYHQINSKMEVGIVGKPNVGKSTFFKALTLADAEVANYPFTTINVIDYLIEIFFRVKVPQISK